MSAGKLAARAGLEVTLKSGGLAFITKCNSSFNGPRFEFGGVRDLARVVGGEALSEIGCHSDVVALGSNLAFEDIDIVEHELFANGWLAKP